MPTVKEITALATFSVRHPVLRPGKPIESCHFEGDDLPLTYHFGLFDGDELMGVASLFASKTALFDSENQFQLRGMAILDGHQKKGYGELLVNHIETQVNKCILWFNAREIAVGFYKKLGYETIGEPFPISDIGPHYVMFKRIG